MYNTGVFVATGIIVLRHWPPHLRLRLQTDPELQTSSGKEREGQYTSTGDEREKKNTTESFNTFVNGLKCNMMVPLQSQWLGAGQLQAIELIGFPKQIIFSFILPCSLFVRPPPLTASYKWLSTGREKSGEMRLKKQDRVKQAAWVMNISELETKITGQPDCEAKRPYLIKTPLIWSWPSRKRTQKSTRTHTNNWTPSWNKGRIRGFEFVCMWVRVLAQIHTQHWEMQLEWQSNQVG